MHYGKLVAMCMAFALTTAEGGIPADTEPSINITIPIEADLDITEELEAQKDIKVQYIEKLAKEAELAEKKRLAKIARKKRQEEKVRKEREQYIYNIVANPNNVTIPTGLKEEDYKYLTAGTWWAGNEWILADIEARYGINAMFCIAVSTLESDSGTSRYAKEEKNFYGLHTGIVYDSLYACTLDWAKRIKNYYIDEGRTSTWLIGPKYCPPNRDWEVYVSYEMIARRKQLIVNLRNTTN